MKLATLKDSTRDGKLVVVSKDLTRCSEVGHIARTLQGALDDWEHIAPRLERVAEGLETGSQPSMRFHENDAACPLPRAYQFVAGSHQCNSDGFIAPRDPVHPPAGAKTANVAMTAQIAVITGDLAAGASEKQASASICLVLLAAQFAAAGETNFDAPLATSFSPVAVTPGELDEGGKLDLPLHVAVTGKGPGKIDVGANMKSGFGRLVADAAKNRSLGAGTLVSAGPLPGSAHTLKPGDSLRIEMKSNGHSLFGAIEQKFEA